MGKEPTKVKFHDGQVAGLTDAPLKAIGLVIVNGSALEYGCKLGIQYLLDVDNIASLITINGMQAQTMFNVFRLLAINKFPNYTAQIEKMYKRLERARIYRNEAAHSHWSAIFDKALRRDTVTAEVRRISYKKTTGFSWHRQERFTMHQLGRISLYIHGTNWLLMNMIHDMGVIPNQPSSSRTWQKPASSPAP